MSKRGANAVRNLIHTLYLASDKIVPIFCSVFFFWFFLDGI